MKKIAGIGWVMAVCGVLGSARAAEPSPLAVVKTGENFKVLAGTVSPSKDALSGKLALEILPTEKWKFAEKAVTAIDITPPQAVRMDKVKLRNPDLAQSQPKLRRYEVPFKAAARGQYELKIKFDFVVCNDELCQKKKFELSYLLNAG